jgi:hypothetical protein
VDQHLEDLDALLLADGQLPDPARAIDLRPTSRATRATSASVR